MDDQAQWTRKTAFTRSDYRQLEVEYSGRLVAAILSGDGLAAEAAMHGYVDTIRRHLIPLAPDEPGAQA